MASLNKVLLIGNLTRDPDLRYTPGGAAICEIGLAVNRRFVTANKEEREEVCFVDIEIWGKQAEAVSRNTRKGAALFVEGRLRLDQWDDRETGKRRSKLRVVAERTQFLSAPPGRSAPPEYVDEGPPGEPGEPPPPMDRRPTRSATPGRPASPGRPPAGSDAPPPPPEPPFAPTEEDDAVDNIPF